jgi:anaerobic selenocysteine-containing dehydrogenase
LYHVEDGKSVEVSGDPDHPRTRGGLCVKLKNFAEHHHNPDRLLYPLHPMKDRRQRLCGNLR